MRRFSLQAIRARVDRLAISVGATGCDGSDVRLHISDVWNDDPEPDWPPPDSPSHCVCGAELTSALCKRLHRVSVAAKQWRYGRSETGGRRGRPPHAERQVTTDKSLRYCAQ